MYLDAKVENPGQLAAGTEAYPLKMFKNLRYVKCHYLHIDTTLELEKVNLNLP